MDAYMNISHSHLHKVVSCLVILPCSKIVGVMVKQAYLSNWWLMDAQEQPLEIYQPNSLHEKYYLSKLEVFMTIQWLQNASVKHIINKVIKGWIAPKKKFRATTHDGYKTLILFKHIHVLNVLMCKLYGEKYVMILCTSWVSIILEFINRGPIFN